MNKGVDILDFLTKTFEFSSGSYTIGESMQSVVWMNFIKKLVGNKSNLPKDFPIHELVLLFSRLIQRDGKIADTHTINTIVYMYGIQSEESIKIHFAKDDYALNAIELFVNWRQTECINEYKRAEYYYNILDDLDAYPSIMYPFFKDGSTIHSKATQLYNIVQIWGHSRIKRLFFMLVFKFSKVCKKSVDFEKVLECDLNPLKVDLNQSIYKQASNALWDYIECVEQRNDLTIKRRKKDSSYANETVYKGWIHWLLKAQGDSYSEFLTFKEKNEKNQRNFAPIALFREFMTIYFNSNSYILLNF